MRGHFSIPVIISLNGTTALIVPDTLEMDPDRDHDHVQKSNYSSVQGKYSRHANSWHETSEINQKDRHYVDHFFEAEPGVKVNFEHLEETNPN